MKKLIIMAVALGVTALVLDNLSLRQEIKSIDAKNRLERSMIKKSLASIKDFQDNMFLDVLMETDTYWDNREIYNFKDSIIMERVNNLNKTLK